MKSVLLALVMCISVLWSVVGIFVTGWYSKLPNTSWPVAIGLFSSVILALFVAALCRVGLGERPENRG